MPIALQLEFSFFTRMTRSLNVTGRAPVKIVDATECSILNDAAFDIERRPVYDSKNNISIILQKKDGLSYQYRWPALNNIEI